MHNGNSNDFEVFDANFGSGEQFHIWKEKGDFSQLNFPGFYCQNHWLQVQLWQRFCRCRIKFNKFHKFGQHNSGIFAYRKSHFAKSACEWVLMLKTLEINFRFQITISMNRKSKEISKSFDHQIVATTINFCLLKKGLSGNFFLKPAFDLLQKCSNFSYKCPIEIGHYYIGPLTFANLIFPFPKSKFQTTLKFKAQIGNSKRLRDIGIAQSEVEYE